MLRSFQKQKGSAESRPLCLVNYVQKCKRICLHAGYHGDFIISSAHGQRRRMID